MLETLITSMFLVAAGTWVGAILFQAAVVAPSVFSVLDETLAGALLRRLFPRLFRLGLICGFAMLASVAALLALTDSVSSLVALAIIAAATVLIQFTSLRLVPRINAARDLGADGAYRFAALHRTSVVLSLAALLLAVAGIAVIADRTDLIGGNA